MSDDFMDLLSGEGAKPQDQGEQGAGDVLGSLLGGGSAGGLGDLLGSLLGGAGGDTGGGAAGGDMTDLLGSLMGGGSSSGGTSSQGSDLGSLLGGTGGSQAEAPGGGLGDLLGGLMGGGSGGMGSLLGGLLGGGSADQMSFGGGGGASLPFAGTLAEKLGISEQMANMLIMGAIGLLTSSMAKKRSGGRGGEVDFNTLTDPDFIRSSGVANQLSGRMGISEDEAIYDLQQTMSLMAAAGQPAPIAKKPKAKKPTSKKSTDADAPKKSTSKATKPTTKKKSTKKKSGSEFQDLLDDMTS